MAVGAYWGMSPPYSEKAFSFQYNFDHSEKENNDFNHSKRGTSLAMMAGDHHCELFEPNIIIFSVCVWMSLLNSWPLSFFVWKHQFACAKKKPSRNNIAHNDSISEATDPGASENAIQASATWMRSLDDGPTSQCLSIGFENNSIQWHLV